MFESAIEILEFSKVLDLISQKAVSEPGRERVKKLRPKIDIELVNLELKRVEEMAGLQESGNTPPFTSIFDLAHPLKRASIAGAMLSPESLLQIYQTVACARVVGAFLLFRARDAAYLADMARAIGIFEELENAIKHAIDETGEIRDNASVELKNIRREITNEKRRARATLANILHDWSAKGILQEEIIATRDGRLTLPVKDNLKSRAKGILVDQSGSGSTVYIEPIQLVEINNIVRKLELEERREIERILVELTSIVYKYRFEIEDTVNILIELDSIFARAEYALKNECNKPIIGFNKGLKIVNARHPLLLIKEKEVVPLNMELDEDIHTLVISGPNAGGKTVALKTVGLLTLMAMAGCFIPADKETSLPLPAEIHAVIGDDQSIAADLSTFTAHVTKLAAVAKTSEPRKLVLIDEILSGTDPTEGTALAISLLEKLTKDGAMTLVTTHKGDLKAFAHRTEKVMNGSLEFDPENLSPTFRFRVGIPGSSYAFVIAQKVGLNTELIDRAKNIRGESRGSLDNLILELQSKLTKVDRDRIDVDAEIRKYKTLQNELEDKLKNAKAIEAKMREKAEAEAEKILAEAGKIVEQAVKEIKEKGASKESIRTAHEGIKTAKSGREKHRKKKVTEQKRKDQGPIRIGDKVKMEDGEVSGIVTDAKEAKGQFLIESGGIKIWMEGKKLIKIDHPAATEKNKNKDRVKVHYKLDVDDISPKIDLRGLDKEEAAKQIEKYLHRASMANLNEIQIIHGKGDGILRKLVGDLLKESDLVKSSKPGGWGEGDYGVTIVQLL